MTRNKQTLQMLVWVYTMLVVSGSVCVHGLWNPGLVITLSPDGFNYLLRELIDLDVQVLNKIQIPDVSDHKHTIFGDIKWTLFNMKFSEFHKPFSQTYIEGNQVRWDLTGLSFTIDGLWSLDSVVKDHGTFTAHLGADISVTGILGIGNPKEKNQIVSINITHCEAHHNGAIGIDVSDGKSWTHFIMEIIEHTLIRYVHDTMKQQFCKAMTKKLDEGLFGALYVSLNEVFRIDVHQVLPPVVNQDIGIRAYFTGEVYLNGTKRLGNNQTIHAPPLPIISTNQQDSMVSILVTSFFWDTMLSSASKGGLLDFNVEPKRDLPPGSSVYFATTCIEVCVGKYIPILPKKYPNQYLSVRLWPGHTISSTIEKGAIAVTSGIQSTFYVKNNHTEIELFNVTMGSKITFNVTVTPKTILIKGYLTTFEMKYIKTTSNVGNIPVVAVNVLFQQLKKYYLLEKLNDILSIGINPRDMFEKDKEYFYVEDLNTSIVQGAMLVHMKLVISA